MIMIMIMMMMMIIIIITVDGLFILDFQITEYSYIKQHVTPFNFSYIIYFITPCISGFALCILI